jgi:hypothetical protein
MILTTPSANIAPELIILMWVTLDNILEVVPVLSQGNEITVKSGEGFGLDAINSTDPDGDNLSYLWLSYPEAGSYKKKLSTVAENTHSVYIKAPIVDKTETAHINLKVTDKGKPARSRYKRIIVTIIPK